MKKIYFLFTLLLIVLISASPQYSYAQWWKDTVWTKETDQMFGFTMLKFSKNDSIIVGHGYGVELSDTVSLFFDALTGEEIKRIKGTHEVFFINNDRNFIRTNKPRTRIEIFDAKTYQVIDTIENDNTVLTGSNDISSDERLMVATIPSGIRIFDLQNKRIVRTKIYPPEENRVYCDINHVFFNCDNSKVIGHLNRTYQDPEHPGDTKYYKNYAAYIVYDVNTLDSIDAYSNSRGMQVSPNCKYYATATGDVTNGVEVYDFNTKQLLWKIPVNGPSLTGIEFSPDDKYLVTSPTITIWDIEKQEKVYTYSSGSSNNIAISHDGRYIINSIGRYMNMFYARWNGNSIPLKPELLSTIFPNPTTDYINVEIQNIKPLQEIEIYDIFGTKVSTPSVLRTDTPQEGYLRIDVSALSPGVYFVRIGNERPMKFMVVR